METLEKLKPKFGIGCIVSHAILGRGRIIDYDKEKYLIVFKGHQVKHFSFDTDLLTLVEKVGDEQLDLIKKAVGELLGDYGVLDAELELGKRWQFGEMHLIPGDSETQPKVIPLESFFKKVIGVREKLRVLEQKINNNKSLQPEEKLELESYISRCYGSLTTFNVLFANKESHFKSK